MGQDRERANSMGLFLQKTNIIRDYLEDLRDGRTWWPEEVWSRYAASLGDFAKPYVSGKKKEKEKKRKGREEKTEENEKRK